MDDGHGEDDEHEAAKIVESKKGKVVIGLQLVKVDAFGVTLPRVNKHKQAVMQALQALPGYTYGTVLLHVFHALIPQPCRC